MDALLKLAADAGVHVTVAEEALDEGAHGAARDALDQAADALGELRVRWPSMSPAERTVVGGAAATVRRRIDTVAAALPARRTLSEAPAEADPDQDTDPESP